MAASAHRRHAAPRGQRRWRRVALPLAGLAVVAATAVAAVANANSGRLHDASATASYRSPATASATSVSREASRAPLVTTTAEQAQLRQQVAAERGRAATARARTRAAQKKAAAANKAAAAPSASGVVSTAACASGSSVEAGLKPDTIAVHRAVCAKFAQITTYGGLGPREDHSTGNAIDVMVTGSAGWTIANWLRAEHARLGISYIIFSQRIWSVQRSAEGWRMMPDRGSVVTANHYDHVHVTTYGSAATG